MIDVTFKGQVYKCATDFAFIRLAEERVNMFQFCETLGKIHKKEPGAAYKITDIAWVVYAALTNAGCRASFDEVGDVVREDLTYLWVASTLITSSIKVPTLSAAENGDDDKKKT